MKKLLVFDVDLRLSADQNCCESESKIDFDLTKKVGFINSHLPNKNFTTITNQINKL